MSRRAERIDQIVARFHGSDLDPHYAAFFDCFNQGRFFEAHEVLEALWLRERGTDRDFYKGLIQLAGAFVHLQKLRPAPAGALLGLAAANLGRYPAVHHHLDVGRTTARIAEWRVRTARGGFGPEAVGAAAWPRLELSG